MKKTLLLLFVCLFVGISHAQAQVTVKGTVISSENNEPVIGASVLVKGTTNGTITDINGQFTLTNISPTNKTIIVSFIGMETQEVTIKPEMKIVMTSTTEVMEEVLVVAYGTAKKSAFTGSAKMIDTKQILKRPITNVVESLSGQVAGLQMVTTTGAPGSTPSMLIRGISSLSAGTNPLIVLDGMPYEGGWNNINPTDVESISVLKDAASTALYGARGANGVVIITTKTGNTGKAKITIDAKWSMNTRGEIEYDYIKDPAEYYEVHYKSLYNNLINAGQTPEQAYITANKNMVSDVKEYGGLSYNVYSYPNNEYLIGENGHINPHATLGRIIGNYYIIPDNWVDAAYETALRQEYNVNISGGNDKTQIYGSFGYLDEDGIATGISDYQRISTRLKASYQAKSWLKFGGNMSYVHSVTNDVATGFSTAFSIAPIYPLYLRDSNGNIMQDRNGKMYDFGDTSSGPLYRPYSPKLNSLNQGMMNYNRTSSNTFNGNGSMEINFLKDFKFSFNVGASIRESRNSSAENPYYGLSKQTNGWVGAEHWRRATLNLQQLLNYTHSWELHNVSLMLGHENYRSDYDYLYAAKTNLFSYEQNKELNGAIIGSNDESSYRTHYNTEGYFLRAMYDYDSKYFFQFSYRRDASSNFHPEHRWGNFYSFGLAWLLNKESWLKDINWIDLLKLKFSIGQQGNDAIGSFRYVDIYSIGNSNNELSLAFSQKGNKNITWETNTNINIGVEFELFKGHLNGSIEVFNRRTTDMLNWFSVPLSLGYSGYYDNVGDMNNRGIEIDLKFTPVKTKDLLWTINLNATHYRNKISKLATSKKTKEVDGYWGYLDGSTFYGEGLPMYTKYMKKYAGVSSEGLSQWYYRNTTTGELEKTTQYSDGDYFLCGDPTPDLYGGFSTALSFKGFDFSTQFTYSIGGQAYDSGYASLMQPPTANRVGYNYHKDVYKAWTSENPNSNIPRWQFNDIYATSQSSRFLTNASWLSLQNIQLGYTFPKQIVNRLFVNNLRIFFTCDNVYYWSKRKGFDSRIKFSGSGDTSGEYSQVRSYSLGLNIQF